MLRPELNAHMGILSSGRAFNVGPMSALVGPATWYVPKGQGDVYKAAGARKVVESGGLCESRNAALKAGWDKDLPALIMSDDMTNVQKAFLNDRAEKKAQDVSFFVVVEAMHDALAETGAKLAGIAPTDNPFYWDPDEPVQTCAFIGGNLNLVAPCDLFFDTQFEYKGDYDYTLAHLDRYGKVARCNNMLVGFSRSNKGAPSRVFDLQRSQKMIGLLRKKWGPVTIKGNRKRPNEILLDLSKYKGRR